MGVDVLKVSHKMTLNESQHITSEICTMERYCICEKCIVKTTFHIFIICIVSVILLCILISPFIILGVGVYQSNHGGNHHLPSILTLVGAIDSSIAGVIALISLSFYCLNITGFCD